MVPEREKFGKRKRFNKQIMKKDDMNAWLFSIIDKKVTKDELYRKVGITLPEIADIIGTNRTYASRAICSRYKNFRDYINTLRVEKLLGDMSDPEFCKRKFMDDEEMADYYGFRSMRSLDRILVLETGCPYRKLRKKYFL